jgi:hypothetical protein
MIRYLMVAVLLVLPACNGLGDVDPVETACAMCQILEESGICEIIQELEADKCAEGEQLVFTNLEKALEDGVPLETACR